MTEIALLTALGIATAFAALLVIADVITKQDPEDETWPQ